MNLWHPNSSLGDMKLMSLASWLTHKETRVKEVKMVITKEEIEPLYIKVKLVSHKVVMSNQNLISFDLEFKLR